MPRKSAGILLYRFLNNELQVFLVHPGGPYFHNKDDGSWTIPKGEIEGTELPQDAAVREFHEETGMQLEGPLLALEPVTQKSGKLVYAWAMEGDIDPNTLQCTSFSIEWPPKSGKMRSFPEIDKGFWFTISEANTKIISAQLPFLHELSAHVANK